MLVLVLLVLVLVLPLVLLFVLLLAAVCADYFARFFCRGLMKLFVHDVRGTLVKKRPALDGGAAERAKFGFVARGAFASTSDCLRRCEFRKQPLLLILKEIGASASGFGAGFSFVDARLPDARRTKIKAAAGAGAGAGAGWAPPGPPPPPPPPPTPPAGAGPGPGPGGAQQRPTLSLKENAAAKTQRSYKGGGVSEIGARAATLSSFGGGFGCCQGKLSHKGIFGIKRAGHYVIDEAAAASMSANEHAYLAVANAEVGGERGKARGVARRDGSVRWLPWSGDGEPLRWSLFPEKLSELLLNTLFFGGPLLSSPWKGEEHRFSKDPCCTPEVIPAVYLLASI